MTVTDQDILDYIAQHDSSGYDKLIQEINNQENLISIKSSEITSKQNEVTSLTSTMNSWIYEVNRLQALVDEDFGNPLRKNRYNERFAALTDAKSRVIYYSGLVAVANDRITVLNSEKSSLELTLSYYLEGLDAYYTSIENSIRIGTTDPGALASAEQVIQAVKEQNKQDINLENKKKLWFYIGGTIVIAIGIIFIFIFAKSLLRK